MIRICIYCEKWGSGGIESYLVNMLEQLSSRGFITDIVTATMTSDLYVSRLNKMGIQIIELSGSPYKITEIGRGYITFFGTNITMCFI